jgi:serine phosphatase RsbU (regulator of sigma subunit)
MRKMLKEHSGSPHELGTALIEEVRQFLGRAPQNDDMCLVCFGRT